MGAGAAALLASRLRGRGGRGRGLGGRGRLGLRLLRHGGSLSGRGVNAQRSAKTMRLVVPPPPACYGLAFNRWEQYHKRVGEEGDRGIGLLASMIRNWGMQGKKVGGAKKAPLLIFSAHVRMGREPFSFFGWQRKKRWVSLSLWAVKKRYTKGAWDGRDREVGKSAESYPCFCGSGRRRRLQKEAV